MKRKILSIITVCLLINFAFISLALSQSINFASPSNGSTLGISPGQSAVTVPVRFNYLPSMNPKYVRTSLQCKVDGGDWLGLVQLCGVGPYYYEFDLPVGNGNHTFQGRMLQFNIDGGGCGKWEVTANAASVTISVVQQYSVTIKNNFGGGSLIIDNSTYNNVPATGIVMNWNHNSMHTLTAIDNQNPDGYVRVFNNKWTKDGIPCGNTRTITTDPVLLNTTYEADFLKLFNVSVNSAEFIEPGSGGTYKVDGVDVGST